MKYKNKKKRLLARQKDFEATIKRLDAQQARGYKKPHSMKH